MTEQKLLASAVEHFRQLLISQIARAAGMKDAPAPDKKDSVVIGLAGGDGIGPIIMA